MPSIACMKYKSKSNAAYDCIKSNNCACSINKSERRASDASKVVCHEGCVPRSLAKGWSATPTRIPVSSKQFFSKFASHANMTSLFHPG